MNHLRFKNPETKAIPLSSWLNNLASRANNTLPVRFKQVYTTSTGDQEFWIFLAKSDQIR